jgi:spore coat polysaccharide biosynthesis protein SpsF
MNIAIIQCRLNSSRLPGKAMMEICGKTVLEHVVDRVMAAKKIDLLFIATGEDKVNDPIRKIGKEKGYFCYSGENDNVLKRYCDLLKELECNYRDNIIRITADCPLIDPEIIDLMLENIDMAGGRPFLGNQNNMIDGVDVEIIKANYLLDAFKEFDFDEHVTLKWKNKYHNLLSYFYYDTVDRSNIHLSLDTQADFNKIEKIYNALYNKDKHFNYGDVLKFLESNNDK